MGEVNNMSKNTEYLLDAFKINYRLRSTFFYRKLHEYHIFSFPKTIKRLIPISKDYTWAEKSNWGISEQAFNQVTQTKIPLICVFSHPRLLREHPTLSRYYRNVAVLSQKSVHYLLGFAIEGIEEGKKKEVNELQAVSLSRLFNEHISLIIESAIEGFDEDQVKGLLYASSGAQIDGSWRNSIGDEAENVVQKILIRESIRRNKLTSFLLKDNSKGVELFKKNKLSKQVERIDEFRGFTLKGGVSINFSSEPDISVVGKNGRTLAVIEVKGGTDPAGALERYGAAKKSFEESLRTGPTAKTIFLASCITEEVHRRVMKDKQIGKFFNLTEVLTDEISKKRFLDYLFHSILKI